MDRRYSQNEGEMKKISLVLLMGLFLPTVLSAQAPAAAAAPTGRVAVVDFQRAITENSDGKKAQEKFVAELTKRQKEFDDKQKALADAQAKLQTGDKALSDTAKADLAKTIDRLNTELQRMNDDAQKDLGELQQQLFRPIAEKAQDAVKSYSTESGFAVVFDVSSQANSIIYRDDIADITTEIIRRTDAAAPKAPAAPAATAPKADPTKK
jgi:outer membrane protein